MNRKRETFMYRLQIRFKIQSQADIIFQIISEEDNRIKLHKAKKIKHFLYNLLDILINS